MFLFAYPIDSSFILCYKTLKICCYRGYLFNFAKYGYAKRLCWLKVTKDDRIPTGFDEKRILHVEDGKAPPKGTPTLTHLEYRMKKILLGDDFLY